MVEKKKAIKKVLLSSKPQIDCVSNYDSDSNNIYKMEQTLSVNNGGVENSGPQHFNSDVIMGTFTYLYHKKS
jgi:hypothetical protein